MERYKYRVYLDGAMYVDVVVEAIAPSIGQAQLEAQYVGRRVVWMGKVY